MSGDNWMGRKSLGSLKGEREERWKEGWPLNVWISWDFLSLDLILNQDCDPVTYLQVMRLLEKEHRRERNAGQDLLEVMDAGLALWQGDHEAFRRMEEARSARYTAKIQKVVSMVCLADVDLAQGESQNARTRLCYAVQEDGTLYVVEEARRMLAELEEKEGRGESDV